MSFKGFGKNSGPGITPDSQTPFGHFPRPPSAPSTTFAPPVPDSSALQRPPRAFDAPEQAPSPSSTFSGVLPATGRSHVSSMASGAPLQWGDQENSVGSNFGNEMLKRPSENALHPRTNSASKISRIQGPVIRSPPLIYAADDFWMSTMDGSAGGHSDFSVDDNGQLVPPRRQAPSLAFLSNQSNMDAYHPMDRTRQPGLSLDGWGNQSKLRSDGNSLLNHSSRSPTEIADAPVSKQSIYPNLSSTNEVSQKSSRINQDEASRRHSLSPPRLITQKNVPRSSTTSRGVNSDNAVHKPASYAVSKRTRSLTSTIDQGFQEIQDDTERELQAKAKRLARFKAELSDPVEDGPLGASRNFHSTKREQSVTEKFVGEYSLGPAGDFGDDIDNEGSDSVSVIVGLCPDMCPESERAERERKGDLDQYERLDGDRNLTSKDLAVKKYNRTAERASGLIRPLPILQQTMEYLLNLLDQPYDDSFLGLYNFLWDRMRAIRMDLRMQHIFNLEAIAMLEQMIRLHIIAMHELCEYTKGEGFSEGFDAHLNIEQMNKTSVELFQMYDDHRKKGVHVPTEKEFRGYYALLKLDKHPGYRVEPAELSLDLAKMTSEIRQTQEVLFARDVARSCRTGNFIAFFRLAKKASYLQACLMHAHFSKLCTHALASLHAGLQNNQGVPVAHVAKWLGMEGEDIESLLEYHGFLIKEFEEPYMVKEGPFLNSDQDYPIQCSELVHSKKSGTILEDVLSSHTSLPIEDDKELQLAKFKKSEHAAAFSIRTDGSLAIMDEEMTNAEVSSSPRYSMKNQHVPRTRSNVQHGRDGHQRPLASSLKGIVQGRPSLEIANDCQQNEDVPHLTSQSSPPWNFSVPKFIPEARSTLFEWVDRSTANVPVECSPETVLCPEVKSTPLNIMPGIVEQEKSTAPLIDLAAERPLQHDPDVVDLMGKETTDIQEVKEDGVVPSYYDEEIAEAKLKLLLRLWRRRSSRKRERREQKRIAASAALNTLSLGPPISQNRYRPISCDKFDIDQVMCQRYIKHEKSWSRLNVSDVVASKLGERNASSNCICWKVVLCSQVHQSGQNTGQRAQVTQFSVQEWLHSKLLPAIKDENDDDLIVSFPGLSVWKKWLHDQSGGSTCCLSVVKDTSFGNLNDSIKGANAILYPVSESAPWETQKTQLHNLLTSLPPESHIPLLILSGSDGKEHAEPSSSIVDNLGLHDIDKSRIATFLIVYLAETQDMRHLDSYFSDERLRESLEWLAMNSHPQPVLCCIKTRELVLTQLNSSLNALDQKGGPDIGPDYCISAFNEALDQSIGYIAAAANVNPLGWPCPELGLLDKSIDEYRVVNWFLPSIGWSSAEKLEPLVSALRQSKLPAFSDDMSWLTSGCNMGKDIEDQRRHLQDSLVRYLTQLSNMMNTALATKEASVILQRFTRLELHDTSYYLVPSWVPIFHRILNWRLNILAHGACATAYVLEHHYSSSLVLQKLAVEATPSMHPHYDHPSLDEMVEISQSPILYEKVSSEPPKAFQPIPMAIEGGYNAIKASKTSTSGSNPEEVAKSSHSVDSVRHDSRNQLVTVDASLSHKFEEHSSVVMPTLKAAREADRLRKLLEQCNILQNKIEEKLWIYF